MRSRSRLHRALVLVAIAGAFLGLLAVQSAAPTGTTSDPSSLGTSAHVRHDLVGAAGRRAVDVVRHSLDHTAARRSPMWALEGLVVLLLVVGLAWPTIAATGDRRRGLVVPTDLPARAPPLAPR